MLKWLRQCVGGDPSPQSDAAADLPVALDLTDPKVIASFKVISADLRRRKPVCPVTSGGFLLLDPDDVKAAFSNKALSNQPSRFSALAPKNIEKHVAASVAANIPPFLDAPRHVDVRQWLSRSFFARFKTFGPEIDAIAETHVARLEADQDYALVEQVARDYAVQIIDEFVGLDATSEDMKTYTGALFRLFAPASDADAFARTNEGLAKARDHIIEALNQRRTDQAPCLLNSLDQNELSGLSGQDKDAMIADNALLVLADGVENVEAAIANVMLRQQQEGTQIDEAFVRAAIAHDTPGQTIPRIASQDMQLSGERISAGTPVFLSLASANDGATPEAPFSFGMGRHRCIGEQLAIAMITEFCTQLAQRAPQIDASGIRYAAMFGHKWPRGVTIKLTQ